MHEARTRWRQHGTPRGDACCDCHVLVRKQARGGTVSATCDQLADGAAVKVKESFGELAC
eukprot:3409937-Pleurochrysis_carterae.AAC.1